MKRLIFTMFLVISRMTVFGQGIVTGNISDNNGDVVAYANIFARNVQDSTFLSGAISDSLGNFKLNVPRYEDVVLQVSSIGYEDQYVKAQKEPIKIVLKEGVLTLTEVTVNGTRPIHTMTQEGMMTNVAGTVLGKMGTAEDVLKHIPNIVKKKDNWEVFGKGTPLIYVNGRQLHDISELDNIASSEIKNVEVIRNPGAKYPASVNAVIRIKTLRKKGEGFGVDVRSTYRYNKYNNAIEQVNAYYRHDYFNLFATYLYSNTKSLQDATFVQTVLVDTLWKHNMTNYNKHSTEYHYINCGLSYDFNDKHSIGTRYSVTLTGKEGDDGWMDNSIMASGKSYDNLFTASQDQIKDRPIHRLNAYYSRSLKIVQLIDI